MFCCSAQLTYQTVCTSESRTVMERLDIEIDPAHLFRYVSQVDPRPGKVEKTAPGGYLTGTIQLPRHEADLKILLSTFSSGGGGEEGWFHPNMIHLVRMGWDENGKNRIPSKEAVPNIRHWQQEFLLRREGKLSNLYVRNRTGPKDAGRKIAELDFLFSVGPDRVLRLGNKKNHLHLTVLHPKTEMRSSADDISLDKIIKERVHCAKTQGKIKKIFPGKHSKNLKKVQLKCEVFDLRTNSSLGFGTSSVIRDKNYWTLEMKEVRPRVSCCQGGRDILVVTRHHVKKGMVEPVFQLFSSQGERMKDFEQWLEQPELLEEDERTLRFLAPKQDNYDRWAHLTLELRLRWREEAELYSNSSFSFVYRQHNSRQYQSLHQSGWVCLFCQPEILDGEKPGLSGPSLPPHSGPGLERRRGPAGRAQVLLVNHSQGLEVVEDTPPPAQTENLVSPAKRARVVMEELERESEVSVTADSALADIDTQWQISSSLNTPEMEEEQFSFPSEVAAESSVLDGESPYSIPPVSDFLPEDIFPDGSSPRQRSVAKEQKGRTLFSPTAGRQNLNSTVQTVCSYPSEEVDLRVIFSILRRHFQLLLILLVTNLVFFILPFSSENRLAVLAVSVLTIASLVKISS